MHCVLECGAGEARAWRAGSVVVEPLCGRGGIHHGGKAGGEEEKEESVEKPGVASREGSAPLPVSRTRTRAPLYFFHPRDRDGRGRANVLEDSGIG